MVTLAEGNNTVYESDTKSFVFETNSHVIVVVLLVGVFAVIFCCLGGKILFSSHIHVQFHIFAISSVQVNPHKNMLQV